MTIQTENFHFLSKDGRTKMHAVKWLPKYGRVHAVMQIAHGMIEFIERYDEFARYLAEQGFLVVGHDHLGHGASVSSEEQWGYFAAKKPSETVVADMWQVTRIIQNQYPDCPYFILGHSMGSYLLRRYLTLHSEDVSGAIICGTGSRPDIVTRPAILLCRLIGLFRGGYYRSRLLKRLCFGKKYKKFENDNTEAGSSWLSKNTASIAAYSQDPRCTFLFTVNGYLGLLSTVFYDNQMKNINKIRKTLPVLFIAGMDDPVGDFGKGVQKAYAQYCQAGIRDVKMKLYKGDRHEILHEPDREQVFADIFGWCKKRMYTQRR